MANQALTVVLKNEGERSHTMDKYIHREKLSLFKNRFAEAKDEAQRQIVAKLLAEEQAKNLPPEAE